MELLRLRSIKSPIDGLVVERALGPGEYAYEQAPIMTIAQVDPLNVEVYVPVALYTAIQVGGRAVVTPAEPMEALTKRRSLSSTAFSMPGAAHSAFDSSFPIRKEQFPEDCAAGFNLSPTEALRNIQSLAWPFTCASRRQFLIQYG